MSPATCSLLHMVEGDDRHFEMADYEGPVARWCPGCGDHSVLAAMERLLVDKQLKPEETLFVSGIGCSGRFPHYLKTYGFHGIHGRALPLATGMKLSRPELNVFAVMGDGDCLSIGAGHWIHATRYNLDMMGLLLDNGIYGLTKMQTSPTTPQGYRSNTQPRGSYLPALNPLTATMGVTNASFVAQTAEWVPPHLFATLKAAFEHKGFGFVRVLQRCPHFTPDLYGDVVQNPGEVDLLVHDDGITVPSLDDLFENQITHDPSDINRARELAEEDGRKIRLGLFFKDEARTTYEELRQVPKHTAEEKVEIMNEELERYAV